MLRNLFTVAAYYPTALVHWSGCSPAHIPDDAGFPRSCDQKVPITPDAIYTGDVYTFQNEVLSRGLPGS